MTDIEIAKKFKLKNINEIAKQLDIEDEDIELYGKYKAKISNPEKYYNKSDGKLILVTAMSPTPLGEGKTTISISIADGLRRIGKKSILALREPSLGPVFGIKGGATGGGYAQIVPMEDINLHFTGDIHAITSANNLLSAMIDNHIYFGNELKIKEVVWKRCVDLNDRQLRKIETGLSGESKIVPRMDGFDISVASEIMAILCLSENIKDLKEKLGNIIIGYNNNNEPVFAKDLKAEGAMAVLLKDAIKPNLVQTLEYTPALVHGGPFANIAHGCNSIIATKLGMKLADYTVTEAGFGADLGAEKFLDIKCRKANIKPNVVVCVATIKAFSDAKNIPIVGVSSLESLACNVKDLASENTLVCSLIDAKNNNVYCGAYDFSNNDCKQILFTTGSVEEIINEIKSLVDSSDNNSNYDRLVFVGDGSLAYEDKLKEAFCGKAVFAGEKIIEQASKTDVSTHVNTIYSSMDRNLQNGISLIFAGINKYKKGEFGNSNSIHPVYLRKSQAERELEKNIEISEMTVEDLNSLAVTNFETEFDEFWNIDTLKEDFEKDNSTYFVAKLKNEIVGFAGMKKVCDEIEIMNIVTKVSKRHLGIGTKLLDRLISEAKAQGAKVINLEVNENNTNAIKLYEKFNFKRIGLRKKYYNNTDDAILMSLNF